jgi:hypothetical protein
MHDVMEILIAAKPRRNGNFFSKESHHDSESDVGRAKLLLYV